MDALNADSTEIRPLTKQNKDGVPYFRRPETERQIGEVLQLDRSEIAARIRIRDREDETYLLDETIVHLIREARFGGDDEIIEMLYPELNRRIWNLLSKFRSSFNETEYEDFGQQTEVAIIKKIFDTGTDAGDFAQVRFGLFVIVTAKAIGKKDLVRIRDENKRIAAARVDEDDERDPLDGIADPRELSPEQRLIFEEALRKLSPEHRMVAAMLSDGIKIESQNESEMTISSRLGVSSRTIRNWLKDIRLTLTEYRGEINR